MDFPNNSVHVYKEGMILSILEKSINARLEIN